jgi:hypothetical protein
MSYTLETLDEGQIIVITFGTDFELETEMPASMLEVLALVEASPRPVVYITDSRSIKLTKIEDVIKAANRARSPESKQLTEHPKLLKTVTITGSKLGLMAIKGLNSAAFGHLDIAIFETLEQGLDYSRQLLGIVPQP